MPSSPQLTLKLKVRGESHRWLDAAALEVNQVFNYCNEISFATAIRTDLARKWLSGFDLCHLTAGASRYFKHIGADTIQRICVEYAQRRSAARRPKLRWRVSRGAHRSLGWIPFKAPNIKRKGRGVRFCGKSFRIFEAERCWTSVRGNELSQEQLPIQPDFFVRASDGRVIAQALA